MNDKIIKELEEKLKILEKYTVSKTANYRGRLKRTKPLFIPEHLSKERNELKQLLNKEYLVALKTRYDNSLDLNSQKFFSPIKQSIEHTKEGIRLSQLDEILSLQNFNRALEIFPGNNCKDLIFNSIKAAIEMGDYVQGLTDLIIFSIDEKEFKSNYLKNFIQFSIDLKSGTIGDVPFEIEDDQINFFFTTTANSLNRMIVPSPYRMQIDLEIQNYKKIEEQGELTTVEYSMLIETIENIPHSTFEMRVPKSYVQQFLSVFPLILHEYELEYDIKLNFEDLHLEDILHNIELKSIRGLYDDMIEKNDNLVPVVLVNVPKHLREMIIYEYSIFVQRYILPQASLEEWIDYKKVQLKDKIDEYDSSLDNSQDVEFEMDFKLDVLPLAEKYASLSNVRDNFINGIKDHAFQNPEKYIYYYNYYLDLYGDKYVRFKRFFSKHSKHLRPSKPFVDIALIKRDKLLSQIKHVKLKKELTEILRNIEEVLKLEKPNGIIDIGIFVGIRTILEMLTEAHLNSKGYKDISGIILDKRTRFIKHDIKGIFNDMYDMRLMGNKYAHRTLSINPNKTAKKMSREEALNSMNMIIEYYILNIKI